MGLRGWQQQQTQQTLEPADSNSNQLVTGCCTGTLSRCVLLALLTDRLPLTCTHARDSTRGPGQWRRRRRRRRCRPHLVFALDV